MRRKVVAVLLFVVCCMVAACAEKPISMPNAKNHTVEKKVKFHGGAPTSPAGPPKMLVVEALKKSTLHGNPQKSVGMAFDGYVKAVATEWREEKGNDGKRFVDYIGWFAKNSLPPATRQSGADQGGVDVKFVVEKDGKSYIAQVTKLLKMQDGKVKTETFGLTNEQIIDMIFAGKELPF